MQRAEHGPASALPALCPAAGTAVSAASAAVLVLPAGIKPGFMCAPTAGAEPAQEGARGFPGCRGGGCQAWGPCGMVHGSPQAMEL